MLPSDREATWAIGDRARRWANESGLPEVVHNRESMAPRDKRYACHSREEMSHKPMASMFMCDGTDVFGKSEFARNLEEVLDRWSILKGRCCRHSLPCQGTCFLCCNSDTTDETLLDDNLPFHY